MAHEYVKTVKRKKKKSYKYGALTWSGTVNPTEISYKYSFIIYWLTTYHIFS